MIWFDFFKEIYIADATNIFLLWEEHDRDL